MADLEAVRRAAEPALAGFGLDLVDVELEGSGRARTLRLSVEKAQGLSVEKAQGLSVEKPPVDVPDEPPRTVDLDALASATRPVSAALDAAEVVPGHYMLELSSPGLERSLRRPGDFARFVGTTISVKTREAVFGARRHKGVLADAGEAGVVVEVEGEARSFPYQDIAVARTVFEWGPAPKPSGPRKKDSAGEGRKR